MGRLRLILLPPLLLLLLLLLLRLLTRAGGGLSRGLQGRKTVRALVLEGKQVVRISTPSPRLSECVLTPRRPARRRDDLDEDALEGQNPPFVVRLRQAEPHERPDLDLLLIIPPARSTRIEMQRP